MTIFDGTKQDILDAVASGHVSEQDARDEFAVRHAEGKEGYEDYAPVTPHDAPAVEYTGGDAVPPSTAPEAPATEPAEAGVVPADEQSADSGSGEGEASPAV